jgi:hypothetical protein
MLTARQRARRNAMARARRCFTCRRRDPMGGLGVAKDGISGCLGCGELIGYYSCAPGYCVACAHDPRWVSLAAVVHQLEAGP